MVWGQSKLNLVQAGTSPRVILQLVGVSIRERKHLVPTRVSLSLSSYRKSTENYYNDAPAGTRIQPRQPSPGSTTDILPARK